MRFHVIEPEVAGGHGPRTEYDRSTVPVTVTRLEYEFADWLGDALVESSPCFIVTQDLSQRIEQEGLTGVCFDDVLVSVSAKGEELIDTELPPWRWMKAIGRPGESDFGVTRGLCLVVSDRALDLLNDAGTANADVTEFRTSQ